MLQRARDSAQQELVAQLRATLAELSESNDELRAASAARAAESEVLSPVLTQQLQAEVASLRARVSMLTFDFEVSSPFPRSAGQHGRAVGCAQASSALAEPECTAEARTARGVFA